MFRIASSLSLVLVSVLAACGGDGDTQQMIDAPMQVPSIVAVDPCPGTPDATVTTLATRFDPMATTITQGQVVRFVSTSTHPIGPNTGTDAVLTVPEGQTKCFRFTMTGTFGIKCNVHSYAGTITVN